MANLADRFVGGVFNKLRRFAPWTPNIPVELGDVGVVSGGVFSQKTTLAALGIAVDPVLRSKGSVIDFSSTSGVSVAMKAKGSALANSIIAKAKAGAVVDFTAEGGTVVQAKGVRVVQMKDGLAVGKLVLERYGKGLWDEDWVYVDEVQTASKTTILVSEGKTARIELEAEGDAAGQVPLSAGFTLVKKDGSVLVLLGRGGLTPLFRLSRVKPSFFASLFSAERKGKVVEARRAARRPKAELPFPKLAEDLIEQVGPRAPSGEAARKR